MEQSRPKTIVKTTVNTPRSEDAFERCGLYVREWLSAQAEEWSLGSIDFTPPLWSQKNEAARIIVQQDQTSLAFAFAHRDERARDTEWRVFGTLTGLDGNAARLDVEITVEGVRPPVFAPLGMPAFMARAVERPGLIDSWPLTLQPRQITTENALSFVDFLRSDERTLPILAFSSPLQLAPDEIVRICRRVAGAAHVVNIDIPASFLISDQIGSKFSVYRGAIRVYHPGLPDNPFSIPLFLSQTIENLNAGRPNGPFGLMRFADVLVRTVLDRSLWPASQRVERPRDIALLELEQEPDHRTVLAASVQEAVATDSPAREADVESPATDASQTSRDPEMIVDDLRAELTRTREELAEIEQARVKAEDAKALAEKNQEYYYDAYFKLNEEVSVLRSRSSILDLGELNNASEQDVAVLQALGSAMSAVREIIVRNSRAQEETQNLRERLDALEREVAKQDSILAGFRKKPDIDSSVQPAPEPPDDYRKIDELKKYVTAKFDGRLILHDDAIKTLADGAYDDPGHLIECLELLGTSYHAMKSGTAGALEQFKKHRERLGVKYSRALSDETIGEYGRHYYCTYDGKAVDVRGVWHIRNQGKTYAPERMLGLYFFWDEKRSAAVLFSGPRKLPTSRDRT